MRPTRLELISVHLPKTAGWSFGAALEAEYGDDLLRVYDDRRPNGREVRAVHGHFAPSQFWSAGRRAKRIIWLRDPVERIASYHRYWKSVPIGTGNGNHDRVVETDMPLAEFAAWDVIATEFERLYLDGIDGPDDFDFVGFTDRYDTDLARLAQELGWRTTPEPMRRNVTGGSPPHVDDETRAVIETHHRVEIDFYRAARAQAD